MLRAKIRHNAYADSANRLTALVKNDFVTYKVAMRLIISLLIVILAVILESEAQARCKSLPDYEAGTVHQWIADNDQDVVLGEVASQDGDQLTVVPFWSMRGSELERIDLPISQINLGDGRIAIRETHRSRVHQSGEIVALIVDESGRLNSCGMLYLQRSNQPKVLQELMARNR